MSKYEPLWNYLKENKKEGYKLTYEKIKNILGFEIDHSFLSYKKELKDYGYEVGKISMNELKAGLEKIGFENVSTYLNSGNAIFQSEIDNKEVIKENIQRMIKERFNLEIPVYVTTAPELEDILKHTPEWWGTNNKKIYDNIIFIIPPTKYEEVYNTIGEPKEDIEKIQEYNNIIFWSYKLKEYRKTNWWPKTAGTSISDKITIRTANTMRKVLELCNK